MHFKFLGIEICCCASPSPPSFLWSPCSTWLQLISISILLPFFISPKELYKHLNPISWIFHANLNAATWRSFFNKNETFPVAALHSICAAFLPMPLFCINTTRLLRSKRKDERDAKKSCRWVIVMVTYTRYTQKCIRRPFNTVNVTFGNVQWSVKKMRLFFHSLL